MNKLAAVIGTLIVVALLAGACGDDAGNDAAPTRTPENLSPQIPTTSETITPPATGLTEYNPRFALRVEGRDKLRACVQAVENDVDVSGAVEVIEEALLIASEDSQWPLAWGTPEVDSGCPLPPVALDTTRGSLVKRTPCLPEVSQYLVFVSIAEQSLLAERFEEQTTRDGGGVRKAGQENLLGELGCEGSVSEAWYLTPTELEDSALLQRFIYGELGIFPVVRFR